MTTGTKVIDGRTNVALPTGGTAVLGTYKVTNWSGSDAITPSVPRSSYSWFKKATKKQLRSRLFLPPQNYSKVVSEQFYDFRRARLAGNSNDQYVGNVISVPTDIGLGVSLFDVRQEYKVLAKLRDEMYGSGFNPAVFIAEGHQALSMIGNAAIRVGSAIRRLRARDPHGVLAALGLEPNNRFSRGLRDRSRSLSSSWLEVNYGWLPLLQDAEDGAKWLAEALNGEKRLPGALRKTKNWSSEKSTKIAASTYGQRFTRRVDVFSLQYVLYGVSARNTFSPSLATVASVAWEKLPYSFVADWFIPIGSYIEACRTASDIQGTVVRSLKTFTTFLDYEFGPGITLKGDWFTRGTSYSYMTFDRSVTTEIKVPHPLATLSAEGLLQYKSWRHAANAVALLTGRRWSSFSGNSLSSY